MVYYLNIQLDVIFFNLIQFNGWLEIIQNFIIAIPPFLIK